MCGGSDSSLSMPVPRVLLVHILREGLGRASSEVDTSRMAIEAVAHLRTRSYGGIIADGVLTHPPLDWRAAIGAVAPTTPLVIYSEAAVLDALKSLAPDWNATVVL